MTISFVNRQIKLFWAAQFDRYESARKVPLLIRAREKMETAVIDPRYLPDTWRDPCFNFGSVVLPALAVAILLFNIIDAVATLAWIEAGIAEEGNPLMAWLIERGDLYFITGKLSLVVAGLAILWTGRGHRLARAGLWVIAAVYAALMIFHAWIGLVLAA